ncbi:hypothetical protein ACLG6S_06510 [Thermodesulfobacteriota bacterium B35]
MTEDRRLRADMVRDRLGVMGLVPHPILAQVPSVHSAVPGNAPVAAGASFACRAAGSARQAR